MPTTKTNTNGSSRNYITKLKTWIRFSRESKFIMAYSLVFFLIYLSFSYYSHINLKTSLFDLGLQEHVIRQTSYGNFFNSGIETENYLGDHFSLIILPISIVYRLFPYTLTLLSLQVAWVTLSLFGIFKLSEQHLKSSILPVLITIVFSWYWGISGLLLFDFHMEGLALPLLVWGLFFLSKNKFRHTLLMFGIAVLCKEDIGIFVGLVGIYLLVKKQYKYGIVLALFGFLYSFVVIFKIMPEIRGGSLDTLLRYQYLGDSPSRILDNIINSPSLVWEELIKVHKVKYLLKLFVPTGGVFIFAPLTGVLFLPHLLMNLLANYPPQSSALYQYDIVTTVGIFYGSILGLARLESLKEKVALIDRLMLIILIVVIIANLFFILEHPLIGKIRNFESREAVSRSADIVAELIPDSTTIAVSNSLGTRFVNHENILLFDPDWISYQIQPEYIIIDRQQCCTKPNQEYLNRELADGTLKIYFEDSNILVYSQQK